MTYRVTVENEVIENVASWNCNGGVLILYMNDGSVRGTTGFIDFDIQTVVSENAPF